MEPIPLSSAVAEIRRELKIAMLTADDQVALEVTDIELELTLEISQNSSGGAGVSVLGVVDGKADITRAGSRLHRIRLTLRPQAYGENGETTSLRLSDSEAVDLI
ncbi:hypothetical protein O1R50_15980 [Glycomyces luteolus]|uniref:Trypsin-co-occurring domain-containing protein n=1 Tax=Glycomyces luteolus TaxID=2670330 RepID=A0A9X3PM05_9ACTN|nr:trypco2 family protein [Glycomyces luteolus]MDA1361130.1 hypothetical protein [Glycomyces luteolus]